MARATAQTRMLQTPLELRDLLPNSDLVDMLPVALQDEAVSASATARGSSSQ